MTEKSKGPLLAFSSGQFKEGGGKHLRKPEKKDLPKEEDSGKCLKKPKEKDLSKEAFAFAIIGLLGVFGSVACIAITFHVVGSTAYYSPATPSIPDPIYFLVGCVVFAVAMLVMFGSLICSAASLGLLVSAWLTKTPLTRLHVVL